METNLLAHFKAVHLRQHQIENHQIGTLLFDALEGLYSGRGGERPEVVLLEVHLDELKNIGVVFHDEDFFMRESCHAGNCDIVRGTASTMVRRPGNGRIC